MSILTASAPPVAPHDVESDPSGWPDWTDDHTWELGPGPTPDSDWPGWADPSVTMSDSQFAAWKREQAALLSSDETAVEVEYRPTWEGDIYAPTPEEDAYRLGFEMGLAAGRWPTLLDYDYPYPVVLARQDGWIRGNAERVRRAREQVEHEAWLDSLPQPDWDAMYAERDDHPHAEAVEAHGAIIARRGL